MTHRTATAVLWLVAITLFVPTAAAQPAAERLFEALGIREGATVCEIGAGDGTLAIAAGRLVGSGGRVFANELGETRVTALRTKIAASGFSNITVVAGDVTRTNFADGTCDAVFLRDVYHHFAEPAAMNRSMAAALTATGRIGAIDFTPPPGSRAPTPADRGTDGMHGISPDDMTQEMVAAGFAATTSEIGNRWFMLIFERAKH